MVQVANQRLERAGLAARARIAHGSFAHLEELLVQPDIASWLAAAGSSSPSRPDAVFLDLGINSFHVDEGSRGFSYRRDGPLDMRFDLVRGTICTPQNASFGLSRSARFNATSLFSWVRRRTRPSRLRASS